MKKVLKALRSRSSLLIASHIDPDGDSVCSQLAIASALKDLGKRVLIVNEKPTPKKYRFLPWWDEIRTEMEGKFEYEAVLTLDAASPERLGTIAGLAEGRYVINVDHHSSNSLFGDVRWVVPEASSTSELVYEIIRGLNVPIGRERAVCLYVGILTDTGGFRFPNTTSRALEVAADLVREGADASGIYSQVYLNRSKEEIALLSRLLSTIEIHDGIVTMHLTGEMLKEAKTNTEGFSSYLLELGEARMGILFKELNGKIKVSLRSRGGINVSLLAREFGGGGHEAASACIVRGRLEDVKRRVLEAGHRLYGRNSTHQ
jgi:phosphoesterase RecJ-like protein